MSGCLAEFQLHERVAETRRAQSPTAPWSAAHSHRAPGSGDWVVLGKNRGELGCRGARCMLEVRDPCHQAWPLHTPPNQVVGLPPVGLSLTCEWLWTVEQQRMTQTDLENLCLSRAASSPCFSEPRAHRVKNPGLAHPRRRGECCSLRLQDRELREGILRLSHQLGRGCLRRRLAATVPTWPHLSAGKTRSWMPR